jgi:putative hydroxymethylpyrimidine transport system substrate-binding protein
MRAYPVHIAPGSGVLAAVNLTVKAKTRRTGVSWQAETVKSRQRARGKLLTAALIVAVAATLGGCGAATSGSGTPSLVLDFTPNAIHTGIYEAIAHGAKLNVIVPGESTDAISLLVGHRVTFAILDIHDLAIADAQGKDLVGVMAIVERPLASVIAAPQYPSPKDLTGALVGVTGDPSDLAVLHSVVHGAGGDPAHLKTIVIGYDAVPDLLDGRVGAATAFWNDEGVQIAAAKPGFHIFRVEDYGAPAYPELVLTTTAAEIHQHPQIVRTLVHELVAGYNDVIANPAAGERALLSRVSGLNAQQVEAQLRGELPAFTPPGGGEPGALVPATLNAWATWETTFGIVTKRPDVATMFDPSFLPR